MRNHRNHASRQDNWNQYPEEDVRGSSPGEQGKEVITIRVEWLGWFIAASAFLVSMSTTIIIRVLRGREPKDG